MDESTIYYIISGVSFLIAILSGLFYFCVYLRILKQRRGMAKNETQQPQQWVVMTHAPGTGTLSPSHVIPGSVNMTLGHGEFNAAAPVTPYGTQMHPPPYGAALPPAYYGAAVPQPPSTGAGAGVATIQADSKF